MKELLNKELKLVLHPTNILFIPLAFMLFIPNYPYLVIMFYTCLGVFFMCQFGRENNDVFFTMMLPVEKHKTVLARIISVSLLELLEIAVCVPIAFLRAKIMTPVNAAFSAIASIVGLLVVKGIISGAVVSVVVSPLTAFYGLRYIMSDYSVFYSVLIAFTLIAALNLILTARKSAAAKA